MSAPSQGGGDIITDRRQLIEYFESGCKPEDHWKIGTEHEKFVFHLEDNSPASFDGDNGIEAFLNGLQRFGWQPMRENDRTVALASNGCHITLEPGGQLELAGEPLDNIHQSCKEVQDHLAQVKMVAAELGLGMLGLGFIPRWQRNEIPWMPKQRYDVMGRYMPKRGDLGLDMMLRTSTVQVNLDFASESDMVKKFRVGLALQPIATALFANSPFTEGQANGFMSYRSQIWTDTDPDRTGMLPWVFEDGMSFERYAEYALDVPMYFVYRDGCYIDAAGQSFRDFLDGKLPALPGEYPTLGDWDDHLTTIFPEVRLKKFMEMRGADGGPWHRLCAFPALWVGLCYDSAALDAAWSLVRDWTEAEREYLRQEVPKTALSTPFRGGTVADIARDVVAIARDGLKARARHNAQGHDEQNFLDGIESIARTGRCPAQDLLDRYHGAWQQSVDPIYKEFAY